MVCAPRIQRVIQTCAAAEIPKASLSFSNEGPDGADTIAWLRGRPESNGRIGMYGFSYQGMTQFWPLPNSPRACNASRLE